MSRSSQAEHKTALRRRLAKQSNPYTVGSRILDAARADVFLDAVTEGRLSIPPKGIVAAYSPFEDEVDPAPIVAWFDSQGYSRALPCVPAGDVHASPQHPQRAHAPPKPLIFRHHDPTQPLVWGALNVRQPPDSAPIVVPTVVLVPLRAFDVHCRRLGRGRGFYDNTLTMLRAQHPLLALGLAHEDQRVHDVPTDPWDVPLDAVITELRVYVSASGT